MVCVLCPPGDERPRLIKKLPEKAFELLSKSKKVSDQTDNYKGLVDARRFAWTSAHQSEAKWRRNRVTDVGSSSTGVRCILTNSAYLEHKLHTLIIQMACINKVLQQHVVEYKLYRSWSVA